MFANLEMIEDYTSEDEIPQDIGTQDDTAVIEDIEDDAIERSEMLMKSRTLSHYAVEIENTVHQLFAIQSILQNNPQDKTVRLLYPNIVPGCEGLGDVLKTIWSWIVKLADKIGDFFKNIFRKIFGDNSKSEKAKATVDQAAEKAKAEAAKSDDKQKEEKKADEQQKMSGSLIHIADPKAVIKYCEELNAWTRTVNIGNITYLAQSVLQSALNNTSNEELELIEQKTQPVIVELKKHDLKLRQIKAEVKRTVETKEALISMIDDIAKAASLVQQHALKLKTWKSQLTTLSQINNSLGSLSKHWLSEDFTITVADGDKIYRRKVLSKNALNTVKAIQSHVNSFLEVVNSLELFTEWLSRSMYTATLAKYGN